MDATSVKTTSTVLPNPNGAPLNQIFVSPWDQVETENDQVELGGGRLAIPGEDDEATVFPDLACLLSLFSFLLLLFGFFFGVFPVPRSGMLLSVSTMR